METSGHKKESLSSIIIFFLIFSFICNRWYDYEREKKENNMIASEALTSRKKRKRSNENSSEFFIHLIISFLFFNPGSWKPWEFSCNRLMAGPKAFEELSQEPAIR